MCLLMSISRAGDLQKKAIQVDVSYIEAAADVDQ